MKFSIIIPALNEEKMIEKPVKALLKQDVPRKDFEIIVIDNGSTDKTKEAAKHAGADKVVIEKNKGTNIARQKGVDESMGKILAFLDADCEPPPDWLQKMETALKQKDVAAVSGPYDYNLKGLNRYLDFFYAHFLFKYINTVLYVLFGRKGGQIMGGNFATTRAAIKKIGGLPPLTFFGDDATIAMLIARKVGPVLYTPKIIVKSSPRRFEKGGLYQTTLRYAYHYFKAYFGVPA